VRGKGRALHVGPTVSGGRMAEEWQGVPEGVLQDELLCWRFNLVRLFGTAPHTELPSLQPCVEARVGAGHRTLAVCYWHNTGTLAHTFLHPQAVTVPFSDHQPSSRQSKSFEWLVGRVLMTKGLTCSRYCARYCNVHCLQVHPPRCIQLFRTP